MSIIIDGHEDLAYNAITYGRDYRRSAKQIRSLEPDSSDPEKGYSTLGWPEFQRGQVAVIFSTLFAAPRRFANPQESELVYNDSDQAHKLYRRQIDFYRKLTDENPDMFRLVTNRKELDEVLAPWDEQPANPPDVYHPVGLVMLMEGADGVRDPGELEEWWQYGLRQIGPAWLGARYCGATNQKGPFTREGFALLERMASLGFTLDISHMNMESALQALDRYEGAIIASHSNARAIIRGDQGRWSERHLTDEVIRLLVDRGGVMGLVPFNKFLVADWEPEMGKEMVTLENSIVAQVDHVCQIAGNAEHVALGTDFDGGFGAQSVPAEVDTIADLQKLAPILLKRGYTESDARLILGGNWRRHLEDHLPSA
jgi:membrane dipeptidase